MNTHGFLPTCCHCQFGHSNSCAGFTFRRHLAERTEKVPPARNSNAYSRCASHRSGVGLDDSLIQQPIQLRQCNKPRRYVYGDNYSSRVHGACGSYPRFLAGCFLAPASRHKDLFRKKANNARRTDAVANNTCPRVQLVPENPSTILVDNLHCAVTCLFLAKQLLHWAILA